MSSTVITRSYDNMPRQRPDCFAHETNDCTVNAFAVVLDVSYASAHALLEAAGRKERRGFKTRRYMRGKIEVAGRRCEAVALRSKRFANFAERYSEGRYLVRVSGHLLAVIEGEIVGEKKTGKIVTNAWRVYPIEITARHRTRENKVDNEFATSL